MSLDQPVNLLSAIDACSKDFLYRKTISPDDRQSLVALFTSRQILSGPNSGFFTRDTTVPDERTQLFTGETLRTQLAARHLPLIVIPRLLILLAVMDEASLRCIELADQRMRSMCYSKFCASGECRALTIAYMRYLSAQGPGPVAEKLSYFLEQLKSFRDDKGGWCGFPYFYTVLMLSEVNDMAARHELEYSRPRLEKMAGQRNPAQPISMRRWAITEKILSRS